MREERGEGERGREETLGLGLPSLIPPSPPQLLEVPSDCSGPSASRAAMTVQNTASPSLSLSWSPPRTPGQVLTSLQCCSLNRSRRVRLVSSKVLSFCRRSSFCLVKVLMSVQVICFSWRRSICYTVQGEASPAYVTQQGETGRVLQEVGETGSQD